MSLSTIFNIINYSTPIYFYGSVNILLTSILHSVNQEKKIVESLYVYTIL